MGGEGLDRSDGDHFYKTIPDGSDVSHLLLLSLVGSFLVLYFHCFCFH